MGKSWDHKDIFEAIVTTETLPLYIHNLAETIVKQGLNKKAVHDRLLEDGISRMSDIKEDLLDLLLAYLHIILGDHVISEPEYLDFGLLKILFQIREGEFYNRKYHQVRSVIIGQLDYLSEDDVFEPKKNMLNVNLQDMFSLSYDQFQSIKADIQSISPQNRNEIPQKMKIDWKAQSDQS
jgi:hypothetical protein